MVRKDDVGDLVRRVNNLPKRTQDGSRFRHHSRIDHHPNLAIAHEADGARHAVADVTHKEDPEFGTHGSSIVRIAQLTSLLNTE
jgi:hypothetical protein